MKGFLLDNSGDIVMTVNESTKRKEIQMIDGNELLKQTVEYVLSTNKGEWAFHENEGINFSNILGKQIDEDIVRSELQQGLSQVDNSFIITFFEMDLNKLTRKLKVSFTAQNNTSEQVSGVLNYA